MVAKAIDVIDKAFRTNDDTIQFFKLLIIGLFIIGIVFGILAHRVLIWLGVIDIFLVLPLIWAIRGLVSVNKENTRIFKTASKTLRGVKNQAELRQRLQKI